jgi:hypothetical protein
MHFDWILFESRWDPESGIRPEEEFIQRPDGRQSETAFTVIRFRDPWRLQNPGLIVGKDELNLISGGTRVPLFWRGWAAERRSPGERGTA